MKTKSLIIAVFILFQVLGGAAAAAYHPEIDWREISNRQFIVVYPEGYEEEATYTLQTVQVLFERLYRTWKGTFRLRGKIRILLTDSNDDSNGSATFFPYNHIEIYLYAPQPDQAIGSGKDWIRQVLSHELIHVLNYNAGSGLTYWLRKLFGNHPVYFPVAAMPGWMMEGIAVYVESREDSGGRLNSPDYRAMLEPIAGAGKVPDWDEIWGDPTPWPGGTSIYLYGAAFTKYLADTYGPEKIPEFIKAFAHSPIPLKIEKSGKPVLIAINYHFRQVFGRSLDVLWDQFRGNLGSYAGKDSSISKKTNAGDDTGTVTYLTRSGKYKKYPQQAADGTVYYVNRNYQEYPGIYRRDMKTGLQRRIIKKSGINGMYYSEREKRIYFSAADSYRSYYRYSDLYRLDLGSGNVKRLSKGKRLQYPVKGAPDPDILYCVKRVKTKSYLASFNIRTGEERIMSEGFGSLANLSLSPGGKYIAASVKRKNRAWAIGVFNPGGSLETILTEGYGKSFNPVWRDSETLYFIQEHQKCYRLARCRLKDGGKGIFVYVTEDLPDIRYLSNPNIYTISAGAASGGPGSTGGDRLVASFYDANGFNLGRLDLAALSDSAQKLEPAHPKEKGSESSGAQAPAKPTAPEPKSKRYHSFRDLLPKYISVNYRSGGDEYQPGIFLSGNDLVNRHSYNVNAYYGLKSDTVNLDLYYTFRGLYPALTLRYSDLSNYNRNANYGEIIHRERELEMIGLYPIINRSRSQMSLYTDVHFETVTDNYREHFQKLCYKLNGIRLGVFFNTAKQYYDSISLADGVRFSLSYAREYKFMGSSFNIDTAAFQYKQYIALSRPNVLALRLGITDSFGETGRVFYMGGTESSTGYHVAGDDMFELMRGYPSGYFAGTGGWLANLEYRVSLLKIENVFLLFRSIERLYLTLFTDIGNMWTKKIIIDPSYSFGLELNLTAYLGDFKFTFSAGAAVGHHPYRKPVIYLRIGNTF